MGVLSGIPRQRKVGPGEALSRIFLSGLSGYVKGREIKRQREAAEAEAAAREEEKRYRRGRDAAADARQRAKDEADADAARRAEEAAEMEGRLRGQLPGDIREGELKKVLGAGKYGSFSEFGRAVGEVYQTREAVAEDKAADGPKEPGTASERLKARWIEDLGRGLSGVNSVFKQILKDAVKDKDIRSGDGLRAAVNEVITKLSGQAQDRNFLAQFLSGKEIEADEEIGARLASSLAYDPEFIHAVEDFVTKYADYLGAGSLKAIRFPEEEKKTIPLPGSKEKRPSGTTRKVLTPNSVLDSLN